MLTGSSTPRQPKRAIIYVRISRYRDKDEKISPELHIEACTNLADREGMVVVDVLQDLKPERQILHENDRSSRSFSAPPEAKWT